MPDGALAGILRGGDVCSFSISNGGVRIRNLGGKLPHPGSCTTLKSGNPVPASRRHRDAVDRYRAAAPSRSTRAAPYAGRNVGATVRRRSSFCGDAAANVSTSDSSRARGLGWRNVRSRRLSGLRSVSKSAGGKRGTFATERAFGPSDGARLARRRTYRDLFREPAPSARQFYARVVRRTCGTREVSRSSRLRRVAKWLFSRSILFNITSEDPKIKAVVGPERTTHDVGREPRDRSSSARRSLWNGRVSNLDLRLDPGRLDVRNHANDVGLVERTQVRPLRVAERVHRRTSGRSPETTGRGRREKSLIRGRVLLSRA